MGEITHDIIQAVEHKIQACGASTGHFVKTVAMCETDELAEFLFSAVNSHASLTAERDRLREENERLRAALSEIATTEEYRGLTAEEAMRVAQTALKGGAA